MPTGGRSPVKRDNSLLQAAQLIGEYFSWNGHNAPTDMQPKKTPFVSLQTIKDMLGAISTYQVVSAIIGIALLLCAYYGLSIWMPEKNTLADHARTFSLNLIPSIIPGMLVIVFAVLLTRKAAEFRSQLDRELVAEVIEQRLLPILDSNHRAVQLFESFAQADWRKLIKGSKKMEIVVQYFDGWINVHSEEIRNFFARGGQLTLVLPNPESNSIVNQILSRFPDKDRRTIAQKIRDTATKVRKLKSESGSKDAEARVVFLDRMIWYCAITFDDCIFTLSPFEHARSVAVEAPAFFADLSKHQTLKWWWAREISHLEATPRNADEPPRTG